MRENPVTDLRVAGSLTDPLTETYAMNKNKHVPPPRSSFLGAPLSASDVTALSVDEQGATIALQFDDGGWPTGIFLSIGVSLKTGGHLLNVTEARRIAQALNVLANTMEAKGA